MSSYHERVTALSPQRRALLELKLKRQKKESPSPIPPRAEGDDSWPLSLDQERLWFIHQLDPHSPAYNINLALRLTGELELLALERSLREIVRRHEILRTVFVSIDGQPSQRVLPFLEVGITQVELEGVRAEEWEESLLRACTAHALRPFDLTNAPLFRVLLIKKNEAERVLLVIMHHIITDWWSMNIFTRELSTLYHAFTAGHASPLPDLPIQYADFARWQRRRMEEPDIEKLYDYWQRQLSDVPWVLELPTDRPRPAMQTFRGTTHPFDVGGSLLGGLKLLARAEDCSLFMVTLAAFELLVHHYTGSEEFIIGSPVANRGRVDTEGMIGYLLNMMVLRADLTRNPTWREFLRGVRKTVLEAYEHQNIPFGELVKRLNPVRDLSRSPLVQVSFIFLQSGERSAIGELAARDVRGMSVMPLSFDHGTARYDLTFCLWETQEGLAGRIDYNTDLYDAATIRRLEHHFKTLLTAIAGGTDARVTELPLLTPAEQRLLLRDWNSTAADGPADTCLHRLFEQQAARTPDSVAIVAGDETLTYAELNARANQLARQLRQLGVGPEVPVALLVERSAGMVVALLGILKAGGAYVPLDPQFPRARLAFMLEDSGATVLLTQENLSATLPEHAARSLRLDSDWPEIACNDASNLPEASTPDGLAYCIYTSGSTGSPKGVQVTHRSLTNFLHSMLARPGLSASDVLLSVTTLSFDIAGLEIYLPLVAGARLVLATREAAADGLLLQELIAEHGVTLMQATPSTWQLMLDAGWPAGGRLGDVRLRVLCGGETLPRRLADDLLGRAGELWNMYGPTETTIWSILHRVESEEGSVLIGRPIANTEVYLLGAALQPVPVGLPGELYIGGQGLARGYWRSPDLTAEGFVPDPFSARRGARLYRTGDLARYTPSGEIEYLGRIDQQVKVRGHRIEPGEIESVLRAHEGVREAAVAVREDRAGDRRLVAYVVGRGPARPSVQGEQSSGAEVDAAWLVRELRRHAKERLPEYMVPQHFILLDALPLTPNGKLDRRALPRPDESRPASTPDFVAASTLVEEILAGMWGELLGVERVGLDDNFFELGGHSLLASQVISRLREVVKVSVPLRSVFDAPTVAGLAAHVEHLRNSTGEEKILPIERAPREGLLPLSFAQQRLWFLDQLEPGNTFYNVPLAVRLTGALMIDALAQALTEIVRRHEVLRTRFLSAQGQAVQEIMPPPAAAAIRVVDLRATEPTRREREATRLADEEAQRPFDLSSGQLMRATLLKLEDEDYILLLSLHHIAADASSINIVIRELTSLYTAFSSGQPSPLPELSIQYADFAQYQRRWLDGAATEAQLSYWRKQLAGASFAPTLPTDRPRPEFQSFSGATCTLDLSAELTVALKSLSTRHGATLFMTLLAAFKVLLYQYTRKEDILVGTSVAGRGRREVEDLIGFFTNTLVIRTDLSGDPSFLEVLRRAREVMLDADAHQDVPFERLVKELQPRRSAGHSPVFQVMFGLRHTPPLSEVRLAGLTLRRLRSESRSAKYDLELQVAEVGASLRANLEYSTDLFDPVTIRHMLEHLEQLLSSLAANAEQRLSDLDSSAPVGQKQTPSNTATPQPFTIRGKVFNSYPVSMAKGRLK